MRLYLGAYGDALPASEDLRRPLSPQGRQDVTRIAGFLHLFERPAPQALWHSNHAAAIESAMMLAKTWGIPACEQKRSLYAAAPLQPLLHELHAFGRDCLLVASPVELQGLARHLLDMRGHLDFAPGCMLCLRREANAWSLCWSLMPALFRGA